MKKSERQAVYEKFGGRCAYCGCELQKGWHVDHAEPCIREMRIDVAKGRIITTGRLHNPSAERFDNYMPSCPSCNINKHSMGIEDFRNTIAKYLDSLNARFVQYKMVKKYGLVAETNQPVRFYFETINPRPAGSRSEL